MANTSQPTIGAICPYCNRKLHNDADIVLEHIRFCCMQRYKNQTLPEHAVFTIVLEISK